MSMDMSATTVLEQPPTTVWKLVSDPVHDAQWRTGVVESGLVSEPPLVLGSEGFVRAGTSKVDGGSQQSSPDHRSTGTSSLGPTQARGGYRLEAVATGTRFTLIADLSPTGFFT